MSRPGAKSGAHKVDVEKPLAGTAVTKAPKT